MELNNTPDTVIDKIAASQKAFFASHATLDVKWRRTQLKTLLAAIDKWEQPLAQALMTDLHKSYKEAYLTEISLVKAEIKDAIRHIRSWSSRKKCLTSIACMPARSYIVKEPLGNALIVSPWNYPVQLLLNPLVGAIAAGCTAVLKPSPYVPHVSKVIEDMIAESFDPAYIAVVQGNRDVNKKLFNCRWDMIFFTGSPALAHDVMEAAAKHLTPVVLELGGKSPCIVAADADIELAARRIAWGKTLNCGQTCIAPDYLLIDSSVKDAFVEAFERQIHKLHGEDVQKDEHYVRMVSDKAFQRVSSYLSEGKILCGGHTDPSERYIEPTLLGDLAQGSKVLEEEIFGPILPVIEIKGDNFEAQVEEYINSREKPLAFYYFGNEKRGWRIIGHTSSGGGCINDTIMHIVNSHIPFGGVGNSGMGNYHGKRSFDAFSHERSIVVSSRWIDLPFKYMPYKLFGLTKHLL